MVRQPAEHITTIPLKHEKWSWTNKLHILVKKLYYIWFVWEVLEKDNM